MPEQNEPDTGKAKTYQSIAVYDGSNPAYFANWHTKVLSHYIVCADSVTRGLVRDHPSMNMKIGTLVPGYVLSANLSL